MPDSVLEDDVADPVTLAEAEPLFIPVPVALAETSLLAPWLLAWGLTLLPPF